MGADRKGKRPTTGGARGEREDESRLSDRKKVGATLSTPWGDAAGLRERRLYPGAGTPPEEVARNQRERLFGAIVALAAEKGYEAITVADVLTLSGVSRSAFYVHFANKAECLTAAASELIEPALAVLASTNGDGKPREPREVFEGFFEIVAAQPAAARVCFIELHAAGPEGEALGDRAFEALTATVAELSAGSGGRAISQELVRAVVAGLRKLIHTRLARSEEVELEGLVPELWQWLTSVVPAPGPLATPRRPRSGSGPRFEGYTPAERIARAVAALVAEKGYGAMSTDDIAAAASISLSTFYEQFADKRDAVLGALEMSGAQIMALAVPAARRASGWQEGVRALYEAICHYFVAEPAMAELATVGVYGAGPQALARRDRVIDSLAAMLAPGFEENPEAPAVSAEAIAATVYALLREQVRKDGPESLGAVVPLATYITLVTFVGPERALAVANGERGSKR
jgi:AcrR family transcriptional regulator